MNTSIKKNPFTAIDNRSDHFYYNIDVSHNNTKNKFRSIIAEYNVDLSQPLLDNPNDWYLSVVRFSLPAASIPLVIFPSKDQPAETAINRNTLEPLYFGMDYQIGNVSVQKYNRIVTYIPSDISETSINEESYWYIYNPNNLIDMFNITLEELCDDINNDYPGTIPLNRYPFFRYDPITQLISLYYPQIFNEGSNPRILLGCSANVYMQYLLSFQSYSINRDSIDKIDFIFVMPIYSNDQNLITFPNGQQMYEIKQSFISTQYWLSVKQIVLSGPTFPSQLELMPNIVSKNAINQQTSQQINLFPTLTDYLPSFNNFSDARSILTYLPTAQYRLIDLMGTNLIRTIIIKVYWTDFQNVIHPIKLQFGSSFTAKLLFQKKDSLN